MDEPIKELARRDAKVIRGGMALTALALLLGVASLFLGPIAGFFAMLAAGLVQLNVLYAWLLGPRLMAERRPVLVPGVLAGIPFAMGAYALVGEGAAIIASLPAAGLAMVIVGMTLAEKRS